jgi:hypothetical protein
MTPTSTTPGMIPKNADSLKAAIIWVLTPIYRRAGWPSLSYSVVSHRIGVRTFAWVKVWRREKPWR